MGVKKAYTRTQLEQEISVFIEYCATCDLIPYKKDLQRELEVCSATMKNYRNKYDGVFDELELACQIAIIDSALNGHMGMEKALYLLVTNYPESRAKMIMLAKDIRTTDTNTLLNNLYALRDELSNKTIRPKNACA